MSQLEQVFGPNAGYIVELYEWYLKDPTSVGPEIRAFFENWTPETEESGVAASLPGSTVSPGPVLGLLSLVEAIRNQGHRVAVLDPLGLQQRTEPLLEPGSHGFSEPDLENLPANLIRSPLAEGARSAREAVGRLRRTYCGTTGYEFSHVRNAEERRWLQETVESGRFHTRMEDAVKRDLLRRLTQVGVFEQFLHRSFPGHKWFSLEGNDSLIPVLDEINRLAARSVLRTLVMGMAHRGRLNVLAHVFNRSYEKILADFMEAYHVDDAESGWMRDVEYHTGAKSTFPSENAGELALVLIPNPSHLELVNPVVEGAARAAQEGNEANGPFRPREDAALAILIHGDAAFAGQGIVAETLNLSRLEGYRTGGTLHILTNNQIGFTTEPRDAHSTEYSTDLAKGYQIPIVHVNGDDVEACLAAARLAFAYRQRFHKDFILDLVGYRRYGHNEGDEPSFTQPLMYEVVRTHPTLRALWARRLVDEKIVSKEEEEAMVEEAMTLLQGVKASIPPAEVPEGLLLPREDENRPQNLTTSVSADTLARLNRELYTLPEGFSLHPKLERPFQRRRQIRGSGHKIDWAYGEALALASILADGIPVRITGQDTERGTFSQRHLVLHDAKNGGRLVPLQALSSARAPFAVYNSPLSEPSVLGFEYGYSVKSPGVLVIWEAQFGDFVNNAQSVVDEFLAAASAKWGQSSGLILLLPHGYEGQGPNHSNAHLERFLQLAAEGNMQVVYPTTTAQYFHLLRRQAALLRRAPRPLVVMSPKSLLRHPMAVSTLQELTHGEFQPVLEEPKAPVKPESVRRVILCSGKVYVDLITSGDHAGADHVAIVRLEELYPFPAERLAKVLSRYTRMEEVVWLQEEPQNRGGWTYVAPRLQALLNSGTPLLYVGPPARPSPAMAALNLHKKKQAIIVREAFSGAGRPAGAAQGVGNVR